MVDSNGLLSGAGWLGAKEIWFVGWKSFVATLTTNPGRDKSSLIRDAIDRPFWTAREPFYCNMLSS